jgi:hypothetical protein
MLNLNVAVIRRLVVPSRRDRRPRRRATRAGRDARHSDAARQTQRLHPGHERVGGPVFELHRGVWPERRDDVAVSPDGKNVCVLAPDEGIGRDC